MNKHELNTQTFPRAIGWIFGAIVGLIMFALSVFIIEEIGFIVGTSIGLGSGTSLKIIIDNKDYKQLSLDEIREKKHLLFSSLLLIIFGLIMIIYVIFNY